MVKDRNYVVKDRSKTKTDIYWTSHLIHLVVKHLLCSRYSLVDIDMTRKNIHISGPFT